MATTPLPFPQESMGSVGPAAPLPAGAAVGHLTVERVLHEGLHNVVYLARDPDGRMVALMEYFPRALALRQPDGSVRARQAGDAIALSVGREAFVVDANTLQQIDHPGLVRVLGSLQAHRTVYRAMAFVDGPTLERHIAAHGPATSAGAVVRLLDALLDALDTLHHAGVVHGCVRPDQILLADGQRPVLLGMGSAAAEIAGHDAGPWDAPEQAAISRHDRLNSATDLYMAAATAWFCATGDALPALRDRLAEPDAWDPATALAELPEAGEDLPGTRERLTTALKAALALLPAERPQRVADLRRLLHPGSDAPRFESGAAPLWVGAMPDRESQWEVLERGHVRGGETRAAATVMPASVVADVDVLPRLRRGTEAAEDVREGEAFVGGLDTGPVVPKRRLALLWVLPALALAGAIAAAGWWLLYDEPMPGFGTATGPVVGPRDVAPPVATANPVAVSATAAAGSITAEAPAGVPRLTPEPAAAASAVAAPAPLPAPTPQPPAVTPPSPSARDSAPARANPAMRAAPRGPSVRPQQTAAPSSSAPCSDRRQAAYLYCMQAQCAKAVWRNHPQCSEMRRSGEIQ